MQIQLKGNKMKRIAILCSGGDCQGMNACIKAVADTCDANGIELLGIIRGYQGLINNDKACCLLFMLRDCVVRR